jgi:hypothetical protein
MTTEETREKMRKAHLGKIQTPETRKSISDSLKNKGPRSEEHKRHISESLKGRHLSEETKQKLREAQLLFSWLRKEGYRPAFHHSEETKQKLRELAKGRKPSKECLQASAEARKEKAALKRLKRQIDQGIF